MFKSLSGMASLMSNLHHLPEKFDAVNERLRGERVMGKSACERVTVTMNGLGEVETIDIAPSLVAMGDPSPAAEPICDAVNQASAAAKRRYGEAIHAMAEEMNLNLPGMESLLARLTGGSAS